MAHDHSHTTAYIEDRNLVVAVAINVLLTLAQIVGGVLSGSLALIADALHNFNDAISLLLALVARRIGRKPPDADRTFGYRRAETVSALINLTALVVVGLFLCYEAILRFFQPADVGGWTVIIVAGIALLIDAATAVLTFSMSRGDMNVWAAFIHNVADAIASVGVIVSGVLLILFDWTLADPIIAMAISAYVIYQGIMGMKPAFRVLTDAVPHGMDLQDVVHAIGSVPGVRSAHHVHLRMLDEHHVSLTAHIVIDSANRTMTDLAEIKAATKALLERRFGILHVTLELESEHEAAAATHSTTVVPPPLK